MERSKSTVSEKNEEPTTTTTNNNSTTVDSSATGVSKPPPAVLTYKARPTPAKVKKILVNTSFPSLASTANNTLNSTTGSDNRSAASKGYLLRYQGPLVSARIPKSLNETPLNAYDIQSVRETVSERFRDNTVRQRQANEIATQFIDDQEIRTYFSNKDNWLNKSKYMSTSSFYSAVNVYLPSIRKNIHEVSSKYMDMQRSKQGVQDSKYFL